jgi:deoxyribodipyrimidine photo-lyase
MPLSKVKHPRITVLKERQAESGPVVYWMSRDQRAEDNWALVYSQEIALDRQAPLAVAFSLVPNFLGATLRQYDFMLRGLKETCATLTSKNIPFFLLHGDPQRTLPAFSKKYGIATIVTDFDPLRIKSLWKGTVAKNIKASLIEVDTHNIVPCREVSEKQEWGAYTIRPKIHRLLDGYLTDIPRMTEHPHTWKGSVPKFDPAKILKNLDIDRSVMPVQWIQPGASAGLIALKDFLANRLPDYDEARNDPNKSGQSDLSPYIHFGQISAQRIALGIKRAKAPAVSKEAFLEELIIRKELSDNYCFYNRRYDSTGAFPSWAKKTLNEHRKDKREYLYSTKELEGARTHDDLWNAAQAEMVTTGKMHGYMRMYWAKKILEWTPSPEHAMKRAIYLNDKYELDGRDPNGYTGIAWSIGGVHDRAWGERDVFGKIRFMSQSGCRGKFDTELYREKHLIQKAAP